jgi:phosphoribosylamine-glycine ligase
MRITIIGNDLRTIALAKILLTEGNEVSAIPGLSNTKLEGLLSIPLSISELAEPAWKQVRHVNEILDLIDQLKPDLVVCLHVESSDVGLVDALIAQSKGSYLVFGVHQKASLLETSKAYGISIASASGLNIPSTEIVYEKDKWKWLNQQDYSERNLVVKANGLAGGRGTIFTRNVNELKSAFSQILDGDIIVQERVIGYEIALSILCHKGSILPLNVNFEYKREYDGDLGFNTPGMGTVARSIHDLTSCIKLLKDLPAALDALNYHGALDVSFIIDPKRNRAFFLEFTTRFGDPELSSEILLLKGVTALLCSKAFDRSSNVYFNENRWAIGVCAKGNDHGLLQSELNCTHDFMKKGSTTESCFSVAGKSFNLIHKKVYENLNMSVKSGSVFRKDIGHDALLRFNAFTSFLEILE